ncbi:hypothetical protein V866_008666 [Kwoniella sp. B9012]
MALPHPPPPNLHPGQNPQQIPFGHMQGGQGGQPMQGQPTHAQQMQMQMAAAAAGQQPAGQPFPNGPPNPHQYSVRPPQANMNAAAMSSQQAAAQQQQQQMQQQQQQQRQQLAQQAAAVQAQQQQQQNQQPRAVVPPSPHHPSPSPHLAHQGFPGGIHPQHYPHPQPQPPGGPQQGMQPGQSPVPGQMRQPPPPAHPHPQAVRPPPQQPGMNPQQQHPGYQQHPGLQPQPGGQPQQPPQHLAQQSGQPQPGLNGLATGQHMQPPQHAGMEHQDAYAMSRAGSSAQSQMGQRSWDSENMLKLYIHDYLVKHNFPAAAAQFNAEAGLAEQGVPINVREGVLHEWWCVFWDVFSGGKGAQGAMNPAIYNESMTRLRNIRNQQLGIGPSGYMQQQQQQQQPQQPQPGPYPAGPQQGQPISSQQILNMRQQAQAAAQANGMTQQQAAQMVQQQIQQQQQQQQAQQAAQQHAMMQQQAAQRFAQPGPSAASPAQRPPQAGHPIYQGQQPQPQAQQQQQQPGQPHHMGGLQPPPAPPGPSHSPVAPSPHMMQQPHPGVMPSPHQKNMRPPPPGMNGQQPNPMMRALTPQQQHAMAQAQAQQGQGQTQGQMQLGPGGQPQQGFAHPQNGASPVNGGQPPPHGGQQHMTAAQQQQMLQTQAHVQAAQQRAQHSLAEVQAIQAQQQQQHQQHQQQILAQQQAQREQQAQRDQVFFNQQQQIQATAAQMWGHLGIGPINTQIMSQSAHQVGLGGKNPQEMDDSEKQRLINRYRMTIAENQRRAMMGLNGQAIQPGQMGQQGQPGQPGPGQPQQQTTPQQQQQQQQQYLAQQQMMQAQAQAQAQAQSQGQVGQGQPQQMQGQGPHARVASGAMQRPNGMPQSFDGVAMQETDSSASNAGPRGASPPDRKRMRRNSGSAAPSPFPGSQSAQTPVNYNQGMTPQASASTPQQQGFGGMLAGNEAQLQAMRQQQQEAKMAYEKKMHQDQAQAMRQLANGSTLPSGFQPHTPIMSGNSIDAPSPAQPHPNQQVQASPRNPPQAQNQQMSRDRNQSKGVAGTMLPPQSPAMPTQRTTTPKPGTAGQGQVKTAQTPKSAKEELLRDAVATPKSQSLNPSPNNAIINVTDTNVPTGSTHGLTPSPPSASTTNTPATISLNGSSTNTNTYSNNNNSTGAGDLMDFSLLGNTTGAGVLGGLEGGDFDALAAFGENFDFGMYLAGLEEDGDGGEVGLV